MVNEMTDRKQDMRVAEILGWKWVSTFPNGPFSLGRPELQQDLIEKQLWFEYQGDGRPDKKYIYELWGSDVPRYTTDPAADYKVLEWVRENLDETKYNAWVADLALQNADLRTIVKPSVFTVHVFLWDYMPGDYSRALLALDEQGLLK